MNTICHDTFLQVNLSAIIECVSCIEQPFCDTITMPSSSLNLDVSLYVRLVCCAQLYCLWNTQRRI